MRISVVLPEPEVPTITVMLFVGTVIVTSIDDPGLAIGLGEVLDLDHAGRTLPGAALLTSTAASRRTAAAEGERDRRHGAEQDEVHRGLADAEEHEDAEAAAADQRRDGREPDVLDEDDADAGEDHRQRERKLDLEEPLAVGHADALGRVVRVARARRRGRPRCSMTTGSSE